MMVKKSRAGRVGRECVLEWPWCLLDYLSTTCKSKLRGSFEVGVEVAILATIEFVIWVVEGLLVTGQALLAHVVLQHTTTSSCLSSAFGSLADRAASLVNLQGCIRNKCVLHVLLLDLLVVLPEGWNSVRIDLFLVEFSVRLDVSVIHSSFVFGHQDIVLLPLLVSLHLRGDLFLVLQLVLLAFLFPFLVTEVQQVDSVLDLYGVVLVSELLHLLLLFCFLHLPKKSN